MDNKGSIFISAGDPSADLPGKNLIDEIVRGCPDLHIFGLGGPLMQQAGLVPLADHKELAVLGFWEVLPKYFFFRSLLKLTAKMIGDTNPKAVILIDFPGFNLRLAARIKRLGIPIIYYISPQVWAWGKKRIKDIKRLIDLMLVIFPFEEDFYIRNGIKAQFTGHPIVDCFRMVPAKVECREQLGIAADKKLIALLPGSRILEVKRMLPVMAEASEIIGKKSAEAVFVVAGVENVDGRVYTDIIGKRDIGFHVGRTPVIMNGSDFIITSSGTATIETAFFGTPMTVIYKTGPPTYLIAKGLIQLDTIAMVNIVAGRKIVPELIQDEATAPAIAESVLDILGNKMRYDQMATDLRDVRGKLGVGGAGRNAFEAIKKQVSLC